MSNQIFKNQTQKYVGQGYNPIEEWRLLNNLNVTAGTWTKIPFTAVPTTFKKIYNLEPSLDFTDIVANEEMTLNITFGISWNQSGNLKQGCLGVNQAVIIPKNCEAFCSSNVGGGIYSQQGCSSIIHLEAGEYFSIFVWSINDAIILSNEAPPEFFESILRIQRLD